MTRCLLIILFRSLPLHHHHHYLPPQFQSLLHVLLPQVYNAAEGTLFSKQVNFVALLQAPFLSVSAPALSGAGGRVIKRITSFPFSIVKHGAREEAHLRLFASYA